MPLNKTSGNMYEWVTHTWPCLHGACPHDCKYCSTKAMGIRYQQVRDCYEGIPRFNKRDENINLGTGKSIFVANTSDLFATGVPDEVIEQILSICRRYPTNTYILQSKNPGRMFKWIGVMPPQVLLGTTLETDDFKIAMEWSKAPEPWDRVRDMREIKLWHGSKSFITIEPIMRFDLARMLQYLKTAQPDFINIGADSKGTGLPEPSWEEVQALIAGIKAMGIEVREKTNLDRLKRAV